MDIFCEQLIKIRKTAKDYTFITLICVAAFALVYILVLLSRIYAPFMSILLLAAVGVIYGAFKLVSLLSIEYEYIVVNRDLDIDKITAKSSRKRMVSIKLNEVEAFGVYDEAAKTKLQNRNFDGRFICCNPEDAATYMVVRHAKKGLLLIVLAMNERTETEVLKSIPRTAR